MLTELQALQANQTWSLVKLPSGKPLVDCRWVYKVKYKADGTLERYKARLVAHAFTQTEGVDFFETFSPVAKLTTVQFLMFVVVANDWYLQQLDVDNAFLHRDLHEEVYMKPPPGMHIFYPSLVCKLQKSLYRLKQASRQCNQKLSFAIFQVDYVQSTSKYSFFFKQTASSFTTLLFYVDDVILTGNNLAKINSVKQ